ncbi:MAG: histidine kinase [Geothrix sp.]|uniref:sensor histidine kinase n=1 Tax=Geothrix sp. TaxID=1962974 RepID=UPI00184F280B|nr:histidine kinase [Geothrix sp.]NWJ41112.1 histidine kinase [Geothrix sp.]WIL20896.1 MAG: histidine kinase [Geothrix sp.]
MRASAVFQATWQRTRRPRTWGAALLFGLVWNGTRLLMGLPEPGLIEALTPPLWVALFLVLAPLPWQWTGDEAPMASAPRGAAQALPWMAALTLGVLLLLGAAGSPPPGRGPGPGAMERGASRRNLDRPEAPRRMHLHPRLWILGVAHLSFGLLLGWILADRERAEHQEAAARRAADEAQARVLQGQMNPHVLFNAISGLTELVREDPVAAEAALVNLSDLLRALLEHGSRLRAPLRDERRLVELHLSLERLRLGHRLRESWDWPEALDSLEIPPLMIQPLVENALKHGVALAVGGGELKVQVRREEDQLFICVANTGPAPAEMEGRGLGLRNLRERLDLLGAPADALQLRRDGDWTVAELRLVVKA